METTLRPYQQEGIDFLASRGRAILADEPGLGKTVQALLAARELTSGPILVVAQPNPALYVWEYETGRWLGERCFVVTGTAQQREKVWEEFAACRSGVVVINYANMREMVKRQKWWPVIVFDECHKLANRKAKTLFPVACQFDSPNLFLLSGSPVVNGAGDLWTLLHLVDKKKFRYYWPWIHENFYTTFDDMTGREEIARARNPALMREQLKPYLLRRLKAEHLPELPDKIRQGVPVLMKPEQRKAYNELAKTMMAEFEGGGMILTPNVMVNMLRLRQMLITPALLGGPNKSGSLEALREIVRDEVEQERPVAIFTAFAQAIPYIKNALDGVCGEFAVIAGGKGFEQIAPFQASHNARRALIATVQSSASWTATAAKTAIFIGAHWTPALNGQAEDRLHRLGQTDTVRSLYLTTRGTVEEHLMDVLDRKATWSALALDPHLLLHPSIERRGETRARFVEDWQEPDWELDFSAL